MADGEHQLVLAGVLNQVRRVVDWALIGVLPGRGLSQTDSTPASDLAVRTFTSPFVDPQVTKPY